jgi:hypothetical protein
MTMKSFAMLAAAGLMAASLGVSAPVLADDLSANAQSNQMLADSGTSTDQASQQNMGSMDNSGSDSSSSSDSGTPDTASGDDDY